MTLDLNSLKRLATTVRTLSIDGVQKANSGHPGLPLGAADFTSVLWANYLRFNPKAPDWANRDRFVLSAGHGSMLLYSMLHLFGYDLSLDQLKQFRQWGSLTPGHPEFGMTAGVEATTGPLGQGSANAVGMALSAKMLAARYGDDLFNYRVFALVSDGDLMEGVSAEAGSLAGHLGLDNLIYLYDDNQISLAGETEVCFTESVVKRYESYGWHVQSCDGHDMTAISKCLDTALAEKGRPKLIACRTIIGFGSPNKKHTHDVHGAPLGPDELKATKKELGWPEEAEFLIPDDVQKFIASKLEEKAGGFTAWQNALKTWKSANPAKAAEYDAQIERKIDPKVKDELLAAFKEPKKDATRNLSGKAIQVIAKHVPAFVGGSADLDPSTKTYINGSPDITKDNFSGKNIRFGVREHAMGSIANGMAYCRAWIPYTATFLVFSDYMRPVKRLAALSHLQSIFIYTHDSFWVGEDGPTHEPIEHVMSLRLIPKLHVLRPADGIEVAMCYWSALQRKDGPSTLIFSRQNLPPLERPANFKPDDILKGAYAVIDCANPELVIVATGSEVGVAVEAGQEFAAAGKAVRVVSMPCAELFKEQSDAFKNALIPQSAKRVSIEAGVTSGWEAIVGSGSLNIGIDHYGASAPGELLAEKFGFTKPTIVEKIRGFLGK